MQASLTKVSKRGGAMKKLAILMIVIGSIVFSIPVVGTFYTRFKQEQQKASLKILEETFKNTSESVPAFKEEKLDGLGDKEIKTVTEGMAIGMLSIPKLEQEMVITEGVRKEDLKYGAGHMPTTALPGEFGNSVIAAHRSYTFGKYFNRLNELKKEDEIHILMGDQKLIYRVCDIYRVKPDADWVLNQDDTVKKITLITCDPVINPTHRLIVQGTLKEEGYDERK